MITILTTKRLSAIKLELRTEFKEVFEKLERDVDRSIHHWEKKYLYIDKRLSNIQTAQTSITVSWNELKKQVRRNSLAVGFKPPSNPVLDNCWGKSILRPGLGGEK